MDGRPIPSTTTTTRRATKGAARINKASIPSRCKALWLRECALPDPYHVLLALLALHPLTQPLPPNSRSPVWQYLVSIPPFVLLQLSMLISRSPSLQLRKFCPPSPVFLLPVPRTRLQHPRSLLSLSPTTYTTPSGVPHCQQYAPRQICKPFESPSWPPQARPRSDTSSFRRKARPVHRRRRRWKGRQSRSANPLALSNPLRRTSVSIPAHCPPLCRQGYHHPHRIHHKTTQRKRTLPQHPAPGCPRIPQLFAK